MPKRRQVRIKKPPILFAKTQRLVARVEKRIGRRFLAYWTSPNGSVCDNDVFGLYKVLRHLGPQEELVLCIKSDGGSGEAALRAVHLLRQYAKRVTAVVPLECASAATMIALGADEIQMGPLAHLTAVDTSLRHDLAPTDIENEVVSVSQDELLRVTRLWAQAAEPGDGNPYQFLYKHVHPLVIGAVDRISSLSVKLCQEILTFHMSDAEQARAISRQLSEDYPSHSYPITLREAQRIGLNANVLADDVNEMLLELTELYAEMGQRAVTDYDELNYHSHEIVNILEGLDLQLFYQNDKDWHYRKEERRWVAMNDKSGWQRMQKTARGTERSVIHVR